MYTVGRWLIEGKSPGEIATMQPVTMVTSPFWTNDFQQAAYWFRTNAMDQRMTQGPARRSRLPPGILDP